MIEDASFLQLQDIEIKALVQNEQAKVEQKTSEVNKLRASLPSLQEQLNKKQADLQSQCCHDNVMELLTDVKEMKEKIKETKKEQARMDVQLTTVMQGEVPADLLSEVSALRDKITQKEILLQQLATQLSEVQQTKPLMDRHQVTLHFYKQLYNYVDKFLYGNVS